MCSEICFDLRVSRSQRFLIVDPDPRTCELCGPIAEACGYRVTSATNLAQAVDVLSEHVMRAIVADMAVPVLGGDGLLRVLESRFLPTPLVCVAQNATIEEALMAVRLGAAEYLSKPLCSKTLRQRLSKVLNPEFSRLLGTEILSEKCEPFCGMVGSSPGMQNLHRLIDQFAAADCNVVILGETGTGKELVARAIHDRSDRRNKPFVPVDCTTISPFLIESELFGHVRGAFTDAYRDKDGAFRAAQGGTVFLDEIGELPLEMQPKLLRALQEKVILPVGGTQYIPLNCRFLAATNRDLNTLVAEGTFRLDLYFRLMVGDINVPPLRFRKLDIPDLVDAFLQESKNESNLDRKISEPAMQRLIQYPWPGNVRQLQNAIHQAALLAESSVIQVNDLPDEVLSGSSSIRPAEPGSIEDIERTAIEKALKQTGGDVEKAANMLGIGRTSVYRKLKQMKEAKQKAMAAKAG